MRPVAGNRELVLGTALMTACIAALVVGGKVIAIEQSTKIMFRAGQLLACIDRLLPFEMGLRRLRLLEGRSQAPEDGSGGGTAACWRKTERSYVNKWKAQI